MNCQACAAPYEPDAESLALLKPHQRDGKWERGKGCSLCGHTGIRGRRPIHDLLFVSPAVRERIASGGNLAEIEGQARKEGKTSLFEHALHLAQQGLTTLEEALRITMAEEG
ncbi:MAG: Type II secretion system protein E [Acidobacteria bacterium ADurb.Bin340]|nr:MAG: Type II secretion system protein E [Acidobacteria bacterium ADurb.Bin340]